MSFNPENVDSWFESLADNDLQRNNKSADTWSKYKQDLEGTKKILSWLPKKLKHDVMVTVGPKALMRGKIVHTNELLVNIGESWFVKKTASQTAELCDRRIKECDTMLEKLKKESELLESKKSLPAQKEAFGSDERPEIIEHVTEEEHEEWKKQHREKEKRYRQRLAEMKNKEKKPIETEEDLWNRLDELELREELEDELNRLNAENDSEDDYDDSESIENTSENCEETEVKLNTRPKTQRVSFLNVDEVSDDESNPVVVNIKHSTNEVQYSTFNGVINTPEDIYQAYLKGLSLKSILKNSVNKNQIEELKCLESEEKNVETDEDEEITHNVVSGIILPDVVAKNIDQFGDAIQIGPKEITESTRKISKFKASRLKKI